MWGTRGSQATPGQRDRALRRQHVVRRGTRHARHRGRARRRNRDPRGSGIALGPEVVRVDVLLTPPPHGPHPGPRLLRRRCTVPASRCTSGGRARRPPTCRTASRATCRRRSSPCGLTELACDLHLHDINEGAFEVPGVDVHDRARSAIPGPTVGYRLEDDHGALAYLPDHEPALASHRFAERAGVVLGARARGRRGRADPRRAVQRRREYEERVGWGHSTLDAGTRLRRARARRPLRSVPPRPRARRRHARRLLPRRTGEHPRTFDVAPAHEGDVFEVGARGLAKP